MTMRVLECKIVFSNGLEAGRLELLSSLPAPAQPTHFSEDEEGRRRMLPKGGLASLDLNTLSPGVCAFSDVAIYCIDIKKGRCTAISAFSEESFVDQGLLKDTFTKLMNVASYYDIAFGYACESEERKHRNRVVSKKSYGTHEAWVGRDYKRYLPGVYWFTLIPVSLQQELNVPAEALQSIGKYCTVADNRNWLVQLYDDPGDWKGERHRIDAWCKSTSGVFDKEPAVCAFASEETFLKASSALDPWP